MVDVSKPRPSTTNKPSNISSPSKGEMVDVSKPRPSSNPPTTAKPSGPTYTGSNATNKLGGASSEKVKTYSPPKDAPRINTGTITWDGNETNTKPVTKPKPSTRPVYKPPVKPKPKPAVVKTPPPTTRSEDEGVEFKIQIGAFRNPDLDRYSSLSDLGFVDVEFAANDVKRIVLGTFSDRVGAESILNTVKTRGFRDAYIVQYVRGNRVN